MKNKYYFIVLILVGVLTSTVNPGTLLFSQESKGQEIQQWLILGPAEIPALEKKILKEDKNILDFNHIDVSNMLPVNGERVPWSQGKTLTWSILKNWDFAGYETGVIYLATYLKPSRWLQTQLNINNTNLGTSVYLDGKLLEATLLEDKITAHMNLTNEKHVLILKVLLIKGAKFTFNAALINDSPFEDEKIAISLVPKHNVSDENILNINDVSTINVSPDGKRVAVSLKKILKETGKIDTWLDILNTSNGNTIFSTQNFGKISDFSWMTDSNEFSFTKTKDDMTSIYRYNLISNSPTLIIKNIKNFSSYWWASDCSFMVYSTYDKGKDNKHFKHIKEIPDRATSPSYRYSMFLYFPMGGATHQISNEEQDFQAAKISPDGKYILLFEGGADNKNRPYYKQGLHLFDIKTMSVKLLEKSNWIGDASWFADSKKLLIVGGPSTFDGLGRNLKEGKIPNDYDNQAYIYTIDSKKPEPISKDFNPSIDIVSSSSSPYNLYLTATDKSDVGIFKYSLKNRNYQRYNALIDVVKKIGFAARKSIAVYWGSSATKPHKLYQINLANGKVALLKDFNKESFMYTEVGMDKEWNFKTSEGKTIIGRLHFPPDFDENKKYPCIVYYYGGTSPVTRDFGGRYPKNSYSAHGYIVYVLQPSGTVGFGQEFSSLHVNDWGKITSEEIIAGVKQLMKEHKYIDPKRIGAMGASYGGFLTQYLATQTDIFAAYISHAGIASLSSYWGVGDWGYLYSGIATANSFPWNRKDIYVGHSPLFMADRINNPLLLLHGDIDNNVPPGESYQMFAALKLLGKEVELITYKNQPHFILEYNKRLHWMRTIIAWWDKHLKKQPQHWDHIYK